MSTAKYQAFQNVGGDDDEEAHGERGGYAIHAQSPEEKASWASRVTFQYVNSLVDLGVQKTLEMEDLWPTNLEDKASPVVDRFEANHHAACEAGAKVRPELATSHGILSSISLCQSPLLSALWATHGAAFVAAGFLKLLQDAMVFTGPLILRWLLSYLAKPNRSLLMGVGIACLMLVAMVVQTLAINVYFHMLFRICMQVKTAMVGTVFRKALRLSSAARAELGVGAITNLMSSDAAKLGDLPQYLHIVWSGPEQIAVALVLLLWILNWGPVLAGTATMLLSIPASMAVGRLLGKIRKKLMAHTDARVKLISEVVFGIRAIKLYAWERPYVARISALRDLELSQILLSVRWGAVTMFLFTTTPTLVSAVSFTTFALMGYTLTASIAFPALALFNVLRFPLLMVPRQILSVVQARVSLARIDKFLAAEEMTPLKPSKEPTGSLSLMNGTFTWGAPPPRDAKHPANAAKGGDAGGKKGPPPAAKKGTPHAANGVHAPAAKPRPQDMPRALDNVTLTVRPGQLLMVVGEVGAGKSTLLGSLLGETILVSGSLTLSGRVAYTAQDPWIRNATLRDNILMGSPFVGDRYARVVEACALLPDIAVLPGGDLTEIGEKGLNLSGGQKHRVALARAAYAEADINLLDDPLSAVDAHVGRHIFEKCVCGLLAGTTRILVTHQLQFVPQADVIVVLKAGRIDAMGTYGDLVAQGVDFHQLALEAPQDSETEAANADGAVAAVPAEAAKAKRSSLDKPEVKIDFSAPKKPADLAAAGKLVKVEERAVGSVDRKVYYRYIAAMGTSVAIPVIVMASFTVASLANAFKDWWLALWSAHPGQTLFYLQVYVYLSLGVAAINLSRSLLLINGAVTAARTLHAGLLTRVARLPMAFFESQLTGRILNRFTKDTEDIDTSLPGTMESYLNCAFAVAFSILSVCIVSPVTIVAIVPLQFIYRSVQKYFIATSRELKRLDAVARSPVFTHFGEAVLGLASLRAFRLQERFDSRAHALLDSSNQAWWAIQTANRWLSIRLEFIGSTVVFTTALTAVVLGSIYGGGHTMTAGMAGFALAMALNLSGLMAWMVRQNAELENQMNSVERVLEYSAEPAEAPEETEADAGLPPGWPAHGAISVQRLVVRYRPELPPVLKGLSFDVPAKCRVGICGRTGCGKSTLLGTLYRLMEASGGRILIDGVDIAPLGLFTLRSKLALVPQDPIIFSGTVRSNLDPFGDDATDTALWRALDQAGMGDAVRLMDGRLDASISEGGNNLSVGQRQLLCMGRALLRPTRVLVLDEATSSVDTATDGIIQATIRTAFAHCTTLTVAHRINTILDSDRVLVLDAGLVAEYDAPAALLRSGGHFAKLCEETNAQRQGYAASAAAAAAAASPGQLAFEGVSLI